MWHFLRSKKDKFGFGKPTAGQQNNLSLGNVELEGLKLSKFRRKTCCVSPSLKMIDLTMFLFVAVHVNKSIDIIIQLTPPCFPSILLHFVLNLDKIASEIS